MIYNNLNRVKGILSARQGAEIPKFNPGGSFTDAQFQEWCAKSGVRPNPSTLKEYNALKTLCPNATTQDLISYTTGQIALPNGQSYSDFTKTLENNEPESTKGALNTTVLNRNNYESDSGVMKIPGEIATDPNTAIQNAADQLVKEQQAIQDLKVQSQALNNSLSQLQQPLPKGLNNNDKERIQNAIAQNQAKQEKAQSTGTKMDIRKQEVISTGQADKLGQWGQALSSGIQVIGNAFGASQAATDSNLTKGVDSGVDAVGGMLSQMGGIAGGIGQILQIGSAAGQIIEGITGGTDQMTATDKFFDSGIGTVLGGWVNQLWGKNSDAFSIDQSTAETVGSSYGGSMDQLNEAARTADKKYGLFSAKARRKANENIAAMKATQNQMSNIANMATDQRLAVQSMGEQAGLAYSMMTDGGYNQKYTYAAKHGGLLEWNPVIELEWEPQVELNWELPSFKDGGSVELIEELEWIPELQSGNKIRTIEELIEYAKQKNPRFIQRLSEEPRGIKFIDDKGNEAEGSHYLESRGEYVIPRIQEIDGELKFLSPQEAIDRAMESGNYLEMTPEEAILFAEKYKQGWPDFFEKFKKGGSVGDSDIPETEETTQKNVIPEGALHKNKHHMEHAEGLTKKGIPVVDEDGEQQAEIEHSEIIFTLEVTKKLEEYYEIFYSEESTNKEKEQAALDAGKLLVYQILENTEDRTGLIESCKKGGSLTLKKSTDDLIEEVLEWVPTIVIVEEQEKSKEEEYNKEEDKSEAKNEQSDKDKMKEAIREVLIELLLK